MNTAPSSTTPASTPAKAAIGPTSPDAESPVRAKKILIVDDNVIFLKAMSLRLRACGYEIVTAVDGGSAVSAVRQFQPDLILLDLNFPPDVAHGGGVGWDGLLILGWLRRMNEAEHVPVIAITGSNLAKHKEKCRAAGVIDIFYKPVDHDALLKTIRKVLKETPLELEPAQNQPVLDDGPRKKILFVDDESDWRYMGTLYLSECGYAVVTAEDAAGAVKQAARVRPDVIVLDLNLGGDSGITLMNVLALSHPHVPILIYTGMDLDEFAIEDLREQGAYKCLRKGTMEELLATVGAAIEAAPAEAKALHDEADGLADADAETDIESILIVEDDIAFGDLLKSFLESHPFCVTRVTDGAEALRQISSVDFDFVLCDMVLPNLTGDELYLAVEKIKPHLASRFIFMTGHHADPKCDGFIRRVRALMLWKPFHLGDLLTATETVSKKAKAARLALAEAQASRS